MEKIIYDTSKLIDLYKGGEKKKGYTTIFNIIEFPKALEMDLIVLYPSRDDLDLAVRISSKLIGMGRALPAIDILIGCMARNRGYILSTKDKHFLSLKEVLPDLSLEIED